MKSALRLQSGMIMSASSSAQNCTLQVGEQFWITFFDMQSSSHTRLETLCSALIAAVFLSWDVWDGFNLIIAADVGLEYF